MLATGRLKELHILGMMNLILGRYSFFFFVVVDIVIASKYVITVRN